MNTENQFHQTANSTPMKNEVDHVPVLKTQQLDLEIRKSSDAARG